MTKKICSKCKIEKDVCEFYKNPKKEGEVRTRCKKCMNKSSYVYSKKNKEKLHEIKERYVMNNKEKVKNSKKKWFDKNPNYQNEWSKLKCDTDILFKLKKNLRSRLGVFLKRSNLSKKTKTMEIIGCSPEFLKEYIEKRFYNGMSWENRNEWHIDHIIPLSSAKTEEEMFNLCHYTNLQPLWIIENLKKSNKLIFFP